MDIKEGTKILTGTQLKQHSHLIILPAVEHNTVANNGVSAERLITDRATCLTNPELTKTFDTQAAALRYAVINDTEQWKVSVTSK